MALPVDIQEALSVDYIDVYRDKQWDELGEYLIQGGYTVTGIDEGKYAYLESKVPEQQASILDSFSVASVSPERGIYSQLLDRATINPFDSHGDSWNRPDDNGVTGRDRYRQAWELMQSGELGNSDASGESDDNEGEQQPSMRSIEELQSDVDALRGEVNVSFAKRMKVGVFSRKKKALLQAELSEKKAALVELTGLRNATLIDQLREEGVADEQIVEKLAELANSELVSEGEGQRKAMLDGNFLQRLRNKAVDSYANTSTSKKVAAGVLIGLAMVPAAVAVSAAAGVAGTVGAASLLGARTYKTYQLNRAKLYSVSDDPTPIVYKYGDTYRSIDDVLADASIQSDKLIDDRIEKGDMVKKRAVMVTLGSLALIGAGAVAEHSDTIGTAARSVGDRIGGIFGHTDSNDVIVGTTPPADTTPPDVEYPSNGSDVGSPGNGPMRLPNAGHDGFDINQLSDDVLNVSHGEGWYQTFGELGIANSGDQAKLLNDDVLMAKLSNMGIAYLDARPQVGGWGIRMPANGKMPAEALKLIHETALQNNLRFSR